MGRVTGLALIPKCDAVDGTPWGCGLDARYLVGGGAAAESAYCEAHAVNLCACEGYYLAPGVGAVEDDGLNGRHTREACSDAATTAPGSALRVAMVTATRSAGTPGGSLMHSRVRS